MTEKTETLRLADLIQSKYGNDINDEAAAELRRLSAENERIGPLAERNGLLIAQRNALLGLLKEARKIIRATSSRNLVKDWDQRTTAAIKAVEEGK